MKQFWMLTMTLLMAAALMSGCQNAWQGAGEDMENLGENMQDPNR